MAKVDKNARAARRQAARKKATREQAAGKKAAAKQAPPEQAPGRRSPGTPAPKPAARSAATPEAPAEAMSATRRVAWWALVAMVFLVPIAMGNLTFLGFRTPFTYDQFDIVKVFLCLLYTSDAADE